MKVSRCVRKCIRTTKEDRERERGLTKEDKREENKRRNSKGGKEKYWRVESVGVNKEKVTAYRRGNKLDKVCV